MKRSLLFFLLLFAMKTGAQTNVYVDSSVSASGNGTSWATAYKTLNEALNLVNTTATTTKFVVNIAKGTYYPTGAQSGTNRDSTFLIMRGGVKLLGGYPTGGGTTRSAANATTLSGNIGNINLSADNSYHVMVIGGTFSSGSDTVVLDALRILNGMANGVSSITVGTNTVTQYSGGGLYMTNIPAGKAFINACTFSADTASGGSGGAIYLFNSEANVSNSTISNSAATLGYGGGACAATFPSTTGMSSFKASNTLFSGNMALSGAGFANINLGTSSTAVTQSIRSCQFIQNKATQNGGGILDSTNNGYSTSISRSKFTANAAQNGGGVYCNHPFAMTRDSFVANSAGANGAGAYLLNLSTGSIDTSLFIGNKATGSGGGMYYGSAGTVSTTTFIADTAGQNGGGAYVGGSSTFVHCSFQLNSSAKGAGMYRVGSTSLNKCAFNGNWASQQGGGMYNFGTAGAPTIDNSIFSGNKASLTGGAMFDTAFNNAMITFCTLAGDTAATGNGIYNTGSSTPTIRNSIVWEGTSSIVDVNSSVSTVTYSLVQNGFGGIGNITANPLFVVPISASFAPTTTGNYSLLPCSPAVDAGQNLSAYAGTKDLNDSARLFGTNYDMGAYETQPIFPSPITGGFSVCTGGTLQLSNAIPGGVWSSANLLKAQIDGSGLVTGISAGQDTITYTATSGPCTMIVSQIITVNQSPTIGAITGKSAVCVNDTIQLGNANAGGSWISSNTTIANANISNGVVKGLKPGTDTIRYYISNTAGCVSQVTKTIVVNDTPVVLSIAGSDSICLHSMALLSNITAGGSWISSDTSIAVVDPVGQTSGRKAGVALISYIITNTNGCRGKVNHKLSIIVPDTTIAQNGSHLTSNQAGASYQWVSCSGGYTPIAGETSQTFTPDTNGQYAVIISVAGCSDTSACISVTNVGISNPGHTHQGFTMYPNPATATLTISLGTLSADQQIVLRDMTGKPIRAITPEKKTIIVDLSSLSAGVYIVELRDGTQHSQHKLSVIR